MFTESIVAYYLHATIMSEDSGRILWSKESKHYLLSLIKQHSVIINPNVSSETMLKKETAWLSIEQSFAADGMPCQLNKLKRLWKRMKVSVLRFKVNLNIPYVLDQ